MRTSALAPLAARAFLLVPLLAAGCGDEASGTSAGGSSGGGGGGAGGGTAGGGAGGAAFVMQPHPAFPVLQGSKAAVIASPKLVTITFEDDSNTADVQAAGDALVVSDWAKTVGADYGVGEGTHLAKASLPGPSPAKLTESDLLAAVDQQIAAGKIPAPKSDIIYMIYIPGATDFDDGMGYHVCADYLGYHWQADVPSGTLTYAIVGDCSDFHRGYGDPRARIHRDCDGPRRHGRLLPPGLQDGCGSPRPAWRTRTSATTRTT